MRATKHAVVEMGPASSAANGNKPSGNKSARRLAKSGQKLTGNEGTKNRLAFHRALLGWYDQHRRDLPWRKTRDPYAIWISEIMLQQTRVAAVFSHYRMFLERFPNVEVLAAATEDAVLAIWSGLGYYRRARMMHRCAKELLDNHDSRFPETAAALRELPGIGRYTAAAVASIAFGEPIAVVDGNVERVLQRLIGTTLTTPQMWHQAQALLATARPADFNQAMMELGATVCVPGKPRCEACPVRSWCAYFASGKIKMLEHRAPPPDQNQIRMQKGRSPGRTKKEATKKEAAKKETRKKEIWCVLTQNGDQVRLVQRSKQDSLMPGMWELPHLTSAPGDLPPSAHWRTFRHSITVTNYTVHVVRNARLIAIASPVKSKWIAVSTIPQIPITGLTRKILKAGGFIAPSH